MQDDPVPQAPVQPRRLMRALVIGGDRTTRAHWRLVLEGEAFDMLEADSGVAALHQASTDGADLIVIAGGVGAISEAELLVLVRRGLFGAWPPPVIVHAPQIEALVFRSGDAFAGCVIATSMRRQDCISAIDAAFAGIDRHFFEGGPHA
jgi:DNA-binding NarL/FixJ family response regulator